MILEDSSSNTEYCLELPTCAGLQCAFRVKYVPMTFAREERRQWWNKILDGYPHKLTRDSFSGGVFPVTLRQTIYRQAAARNMVVVTHKPRWDLVMYVQALPAGSDPDDFVNLEDPEVQQQLKPELTAAAFIKEREDFKLLGPCTCGQAPTCTPSCARSGGAYTGPLPPSWSTRNQEPGPVDFPPEPAW